MKRLRKSLAAILLVLTLAAGLFYSENANVVRADGVSVTIAISASNVRIGQSVTATINVSGSSISAYTMYVSYSSSVLQYSSATGVVGGGGGTLTVSGTGPGATSITFSAIANGTASIGTSGTEFYDINGTALDVSHAGVSVTVATEDNTTAEPTTNEQGETEAATEEDTRSNNCDLASLTVSPGSLSPAFSASQTSYTVTLTEDDTSIVVSAVPDSDKASTSVSGANSLSRGTNRVSVTVTAENGAVKVYYITVMCGEDKENILVEVEGRNYTVVTENLPEAPENFEEITATINDEEVPALQAPNGKLTLIALESEDGEKGWYIYNETDGSFTRYAEFSSEYVRYVILKKPEAIEVPEGFTETVLSIDEDEFAAYTDGSDSGIYLIYAMNLDGDMGFYFYDSKEGSFMRFEAAEAILSKVREEQTTETVTEAPAPTTEEITELIPKKSEEPKDEGFFTKDNLKFLLIAMTVLFLIMCVAVIVLVIRNSGLQNRLEGFDGSLKADDEDDEKESEIPGVDELLKSVEETTATTAAGMEETLSKSKTYGVNDDTGEILLEAAEDFNSGVNVPPAMDIINDSIEDAKKDRPFGIDSAFDVVAASPEDAADTADTVTEEAADTVNAAAEEAVEAAGTAADLVDDATNIVTDNAAGRDITEILKSGEESKEDKPAYHGPKGVYTEVKEAPAAKIILPGQNEEED